MSEDTTVERRVCGRQSPVPMNAPWSCVKAEHHEPPCEFWPLGRRTGEAAKQKGVTDASPHA